MRSRAEQTLSNLGPQVYAVFSAYPAVTYACAGLLAVATNCANPSWRGLSKTATALTSSLIVGHKLFQRQYKCFVLAMSVIGMAEYDGKRPENLARWLWSVHTQVVRGMVYGRCTWASGGTAHPEETHVQQEAPYCTLRGTDKCWRYDRV